MKKIALVGDGGVGKTTFVKLLLTNTFETKYVPTLGVEPRQCNSNNYNGHQNRYDIWDVAGQEKFSGLKEGYYIGSDAAIVMFDLSNKKSFENVPKWIKHLQITTKNIPILVCGNKCELTPVISQDDIKILKNMYNIGYVEISVKNNYNCHSVLKHFDEVFGWVMA